MKPVLGMVGALAMTLSLIGMGEAVQVPGKGGKRVIQGHDLVSADKLGNLPDGKHHVKTIRGGHKLHVHAKDGKVAGMSATDSQGRQHKMKHRVVRRPAGGGRPVALDGEALSAQELAALAELDRGDPAVPVSTQVGPQVFVLFTFTPPTPGPHVVIVFPGSSVSPTLIIIA
jgi:hypothetical protein